MALLKEVVQRALDKGISKSELVPELLKKGYMKKEIDEAFGVLKEVKKQNERGREELDYFEKIKYLFSNPKGFFENVRDEGIGKSLTMYTVMGLIVVLFSMGISFIFSRSAFGYLGVFSLFGFYGFGGLFYFIILLVIGIAETFVYSGISHIMAKGLGGEGSYIDSYNAVSYSLIPSLFFLVIPFIGWLGIIYSVVLMSFGLSEYHGIPKGKAVWAALLPLIIAFVLFALFVMFLIYSFRGGLF